MRPSKFMEKAYSEMEKAVDKMKDDERYELQRDLGNIAEQAAFMSEYVDQRYGHGCGDQGHRQAVKKANSLLRKVRKAMGFNITHDIHI